MTNINRLIISAYSFNKHNRNKSSVDFVLVNKSIAGFACAVKKPIRKAVITYVGILCAAVKGGTVVFIICLFIFGNIFNYCRLKLILGLCVRNCFCFCSVFRNIVIGIVFNIICIIERTEAEVHRVIIIFICFIAVAHFLLGNLHGILLGFCVSCRIIADFRHSVHGVIVHSGAVHSSDIFLKRGSVIFRRVLKV